MIKKKIVQLYAIIFLVSAINCPFLFSQNTDQIDKSTLAFINAVIYPSPADASIPDGIVLTHDDKIIAVGKKGTVKIPDNATIIDCRGLSITAGFWNSHVHFTDPKIANAQNLSNKELSDYLQHFLTMYGFIHVFDIGSFPENTANIKQRIENDSIFGPHILTTGLPLTPENGTPFYVKAMNIRLPELNNAAIADKIVNQNIDSGLDGVKIFAGSPMGAGKGEKIMPLEIAKAVTNAAHKKKKPVFAHPSVNEGVKVAIESGVDILAHTTPDGKKAWDSNLIQQMIANNTYLIPTLKLWKWSLLNNGGSKQQIEDFVTIAIKQVKEFNEAGGNILFGTDIGFMDDFDPTDEYIYLQNAGLDFSHILATLTTIPSKKFGFSKQFGRIAVGMNADMVFFRGNPELDLTALTNVKYTVRNGKMIYVAP